MTLPPSAPRRLAARGLFWAQVGLGMLTGLGLTLGLVALGQAGWWTPVVVPVLMAWLGLGIAGLLALERRKSPAPSSGVEWARHVRQLRDSRLEIVTAFEIERRRIERDLHDGAQQHLVAASLKIGEATFLLDTQHTAPSHVAGLLAQAQDATESALAELRATVAGIHPAVLADLGLQAAVGDLIERSPLAVVLRVPHPLPAMPPAVAAAAYFLTAEALTNITKHAPHAHATVLLASDEALHISIVDDGPGGAHLQPGHGLAGMSERLAAFDGTLTITSPPGGPTTISAHLPLLLEAHQPGTTWPTNAAAQS